MNNKNIIVLIIFSISIVIFYYFLFSNNVEKQIYNSYINRNISSSSFDNILKVMPEIDWKRYEEIKDNNAYELLNWLSTKEYKNKDQMLYIMKVVNTNLDGVLAEQYSYLIYNMFQSNMVLFLETLALLTDKEIDDLINYLTYYINYLSDEEKDILINDIKNLKVQNEIEPLIFEKLIKKLDMY